MELSHCVIYLLLAVLITTSGSPINGRYSLMNLRKLTKISRATIIGDNSNSKDSTVFLSIEEDSNSVDDLAQKVLSALNVSNSAFHLKQHFSERQDGTRRGRVRRSDDEKKLGIFGRDDRVNIQTSREAQIYPFSTAVMLSSGCTGTLIGSQHVLTAAHCVHNRKSLLKSAKHLKVGLLQRSGRFHWIRVERRYIPKGWRQQSSSNKLRYDFAVLKLKRQHNRQHMSVQTSSLLPGSKIQFSGFHGDKWYNSLWYTYCHVYRKSEDMILNFCDGAKGVSGSGVYVDTPRGNENAVVGVVSAIAQGKVKGKVIKFNVVNSFTKAKVRQISRWVDRR